MTVDGRFDPEELGLAAAFGDVVAPAGVRRWDGGAAEEAPTRPVRRLLRRGDPAEALRLGPLALAVAMALAIGAAGGAAGLARHLAGRGGGVAATTGTVGTPPGRMGAAMVWDGARHVVVMFGGRDSAKDLSDTWTWDGSVWRQQHPRHVPQARMDAAMAFDDQTGQVVMVGGTSLWWTQRNPQRFNCSTPDAALGLSCRGGIFIQDGSMTDTWTWDGSDWTEGAPIMDLLTPATWGMTYDPRSRSVVLVGRRGTVDWKWSPPSSEPIQVPLSADRNLVPIGEGATWTWDGHAWTERSGAGTPVGNAIVAYDAMLDHVVLIRMDLLSDPCQGTWWSSPLPSGAPHSTDPGSIKRGLLGSVDVVCAIAGLASPADAPSLWTWDGSAWRQGQVKGALLRPGAVSADPTSGGVLALTLTGASVRLAGTTWQTLRPSLAPDIRMGAAMAPDPDHHSVVLFGGAGTDGFPSDTWTWDGQTWKRRAG